MGAEERLERLGDGLDKVIIRADTQGGDFIADGAPPRDDHQQHIAGLRTGAEPLEQGETVAIGQGELTDDERRDHHRKRLVGGCERASDADGVACGERIRKDMRRRAVEMTKRTAGRKAEARVDIESSASLNSVAIEQGDNRRMVGIV